MAESQSATMMAPAPLESALCLAGNPAHVFANSSIDATGNKWLLNFGSQSAGRPGFCIDEDHCAMVAAGCPGIRPTTQITSGTNRPMTAMIPGPRCRDSDGSTRRGSGR